MLITLLSTIVVLSVLILVHEFGHFFAAKSVGILAPRFSLGFGPRVWGFRVGETEFVLSAIPLGGYVKMAGMEDDEASEALEGAGPAEPVDPTRTFDSKPLWARAWVISAGVIMNLLFAALVFTVLGLMYGERLTPDTRVAPAPASLVASPAVSAQLARLPFGARLEAVDGREVRTWEEAVQALALAPAGPTQLTFADAPPATLELSAAQEEREGLLRAMGPFSEPVVLQVEGGSPAARGGLREGDRVLSANGAPVRTWAELVAQIRASPGKPLALDVQRTDGSRTRLTVTPEADRGPDASGETVTFGRVGAGGGETRTAHRDLGFVEAVGMGFRETWNTVVLIAETLRQLVTGQLSARNMGGLLTIGEASGDSARAGLPAFLAFLALFSVNLAVLNLLPIPILDGGHLMFLAIEAVRGRPLSVESRIRLSHVGLILVVGLMLWANGNDVVRLIERSFGG